MTIYVRTSQDPALAAGVARREVQRLDPNLPVTNLATMDQLIDDNIWLDRVVAALSMGFGLLATVLAAIGLYGVLAFMVAQEDAGNRHPAGGGRIASDDSAAGDDRSELAWREPASWWQFRFRLRLTRYVKSQLFGLSSTDPWTLTGAALFLALVGAIVAAYFPARRAMRVDPVRALRWE